MSGDSSKSVMSTDKAAPNFGGSFRAILNALFIFLFSQLLAALLIESFSAIILGRSTTESILASSAMAQFFYILIAEAIVIGSVLYILKRRRLSLRTIGWGRPLKAYDLKMAAAGFLIFFLLLIVVTATLTALIPSYNIDQVQDVGFKTVSQGPDKILAFVALVILPPIGEELLMRGYLFSALRARWSFPATMLVISGLFGAAHLLTGQDGLLWAAAVSTFILSAVLVYLRERTGALYAGMMVHGFNNLIAFTVYFHATVF